MALTSPYGVNPEYENKDNIYRFSGEGGYFIIDGSGVDTIEALSAEEAVYIDLRQGAHSYLGVKEHLITKPYQLTISNGSYIENVQTGMGNDTVIGNEYANHISTFDGVDTIFAGEGEDIINSGSGADLIDLSEQVQSKDITSSQVCRVEIVSTQSMDLYRSAW